MDDDDMIDNQTQQQENGGQLITRVTADDQHSTVTPTSGETK